MINAMSRDVSIAETYRGALPFVVSDIIRIAILVAFPFITLFLVRLFYRVIRGIELQPRDRRAPATAGAGRRR